MSTTGLVLVETIHSRPALLSVLSLRSSWPPPASAALTADGIDPVNEKMSGARPLPLDSRARGKRQRDEHSTKS
jgi:hypothetical protein